MSKYPLSEVVRDSRQLSDKQLRERLRYYVPSAIDRLVQLANSTNPNVALGALKIILSKTIPDLKSTEISKETREMFIAILGGKSSVQSNDSYPQIIEPE